MRGKIKDGCRLHLENDLWLYVPQAGAKLCVRCLKAGLFNREVTEAATGIYPQHFNTSTSEDTP